MDNNTVVNDAIMAHVLIIRHSVTAGNLRHAYVGGRTDEPLCAEGQALLEQVTPQTEYERVFVSPMIRAKQTAAHCFPRAEFIEVPALREMDFGIFEGKNFEDLSENKDYRKWVEGYCSGRCPEGECWEEVQRRVMMGFEQILYKEINPSLDSNSLVIVAHGGTIMALMEELFYPRGVYDRYHWKVKNCEGFAFDVIKRTDGKLEAKHIVPVDLKKGQ